MEDDILSSVFLKEMLLIAKKNVVKYLPLIKS